MTYKVQIDDTVREATADEIARIDQTHVAAQAVKQAEADADSAKKSARAKLAALGLSDNEIVALMGV